MFQFELIDVKNSLRINKITKICPIPVLSCQLSIWRYDALIGEMILQGFLLLWCVDIPIAAHVNTVDVTTDWGHPMMPSYWNENYRFSKGSIASNSRNNLTTNIC
jgi:hypothetical protein